MRCPGKRNDQFLEPNICVAANAGKDPVDLQHLRQYLSVLNILRLTAWLAVGYFEVHLFLSNYRGLLIDDYERFAEFPIEILHFFSKSCLIESVFEELDDGWRH